MRWARRAFHNNEIGYDTQDEVSMAEAAPPGSDRLLFLPYLNGEEARGCPPTREASSLARGAGTTRVIFIAR